MSFGLAIAGLASALEMFEALQVVYDDVDEEVYVAAPTVNYAVHQEQGTSDISPRPYMRPAAEKVRRNPQAMLQRYGGAAPDAGTVETLAIAVQNEAKKIADRKDVRDTGALINSITYEER
jgi:hypothetical protein